MKECPRKLFSLDYGARLSPILKGFWVASLIGQPHIMTIFTFMGILIFSPISFIFVKDRSLDWHTNDLLVSYHDYSRGVALGIYTTFWRHGSLLKQRKGQEKKR